MGKLLYREGIIVGSLVATRRVFPWIHRLACSAVNTARKPTYEFGGAELCAYPGYKQRRGAISLFYAVTQTRVESG